MLSHLFCSLAFAGVVVASNSNDSSSACFLDTTAVDNAVAWGTAGTVYTGTPNDLQTGPEFQWLYTVAEDGTWNVTLAARPEEKLPDKHDFYTICGIDLAINELAIERGQNDTGECIQALSPSCSRVLSGAALEASTNASRSMGMESYKPALACSQIKDAVAQAAQQNASCTPFFGSAQTPDVKSWLVNDPTTNQTLCNSTLDKFMPGWSVAGTGVLTDVKIQDIFNDDGPHAAYDEAYRNVKAIMTVYLPNYVQSETGGNPGSWVGDADLSCLRVTNTTSSSTRIPAELPKAPMVSDESSSASVPAVTKTVYCSAVVMAVLTAFVFGCQIVW